MSEYGIEELQPEHFDELGPLMENAFGGTVMPNYFQWKYLQNPAGAAVGRIARADDGSVAAFYGMIPELYRFSGKMRRIYQSCDTMTHSAHRRKGLFQRLALETYAQSQDQDPDFFAFGFSGDMSTPGFVKMDWRIEAELPHFFRPFPLTLTGSLRSADCAEAQIDAEFIDTMLAVAPATDGLVKSANFLQWRLSNPQREYRALVIPGTAYAIYVRESSFLFLLDFGELKPGSGTQIFRRLDRLSTRSRMKGVLTWATPSSSLAQALTKAGYLRNKLGKGPGSHRIPLISFGQRIEGTSMAALSITPLDHDSL